MPTKSKKINNALPAGEARKATKTCGSFISLGGCPMCAVEGKEDLRVCCAFCGLLGECSSAKLCSFVKNDSANEEFTT